MPACERVKARKAPMAKSGMRRSVTPPKTIRITRREDGEDDDALGVDQAAAADREEAGEVAVFRDGAAEARKIGERGVGGERKHTRMEAMVM